MKGRLTCWKEDWNFHELPNLPGLTTQMHTHTWYEFPRSLPKMFPVCPCQPFRCFQTSPAGIGFYEFLVHARRVREQQMQLVAQEVEAICCDTKTCLLEDPLVICWPWCTQGTKSDIMLVLLWYINCKEFMWAHFFGLNYSHLPQPQKDAVLLRVKHLHKVLGDCNESQMGLFEGERFLHHLPQNLPGLQKALSTLWLYTSRSGSHRNL